MPHLAIYRKYRPGTFEDLLGQETIVKILKEEARQDRLSHAYIFSGPRGTGKTTSARLIAKIANCEKRESDPEFKKKGEPCNVCQSCKNIDEGKNLDVMEIDGASNRGVDEIRNLKESIRTGPSNSRFKVYIIDEAHMLTKDAWNALLKTLEEPPAYIIIILATTEMEKVPATIASRAQKFYFKLVPREEIVKKLTKIAKEEDIKISPEALDLIADYAEGSFRDSESLLDQMISFGLAAQAGDKKIEVEEIEKAVGKIGFDKIDAFVELLMKGDEANTLKFVSEISDSGFNLTQFLRDVIQHLRRIMVLKINPQMEIAFKKEMMAEHLTKLITQSKNFKQAHVALIKTLINAYGEMRYSQFPRIPLEVAIVEGLYPRGTGEAPRG